jgi:hypothetical protein
MDVRPPAARAPKGPEPRRAFVLAIAANDNQAPAPLAPSDDLAAWFSDIGAACRRLAATQASSPAPTERPSSPPARSAGRQRLALDAFGSELSSLLSGFRPSLDSIRPTGK